MIVDDWCALVQVIDGRVFGHDDRGITWMGVTSPLVVRGASGLVCAIVMIVWACLRSFRCLYEPDISVTCEGAVNLGSRLLVKLFGVAGRMSRTAYGQLVATN